MYLGVESRLPLLAILSAFIFISRLLLPLPVHIVFKIKNMFLVNCFIVVKLGITGKLNNSI